MIVKKIEFEILVLLSNLGSPRIKKWFVQNVCMYSYVSSVFLYLTMYLHMFAWSPRYKTYLVDVNKISNKFITLAHIEVREGFWKFNTL